MTIKERPILFNTEMVEAILEGRKTQTRRPMKPQPPHHEFQRIPTQRLNIETSGHQFVHCPYGQPGDRLWVRETWCWPFSNEYIIPSEIPEYKRSEIRYKADGIEYTSWRPSIHMPRWASRITLKITNIRVERVQEISETEVRKEGIALDNEPCDHPRRSCEDVGCAGKRSIFVDTWNKIYGKTFPWSSNPWVWVVEFKRI